MGFNFGAFAGGLAEAGADTYVKVKEQGRRDAEALQRQEMHEAWKKEQAQNEAIDAAYAETLGRAGTPEAFRTAGGAMGPQPDGSQTALPADAAAAFPKQAMYGRDQAMKDYQNKVMGINARKGAEVLGKMQGLRKGELELASAERDAKFMDKFDKFNDETHKMVFDLHHEIDDHIATNGLKGALDKYAAQYKQATGNTVQLVGKEMVVKDREGKVLGKTSDPVAITNGLSEALETHLMTKRGNDMIKAGMFKNPSELQSFLKDRNTMEAQTSNAQSSRIQALAAEQNAATHAAIAPSTIAQNRAQAAMYTAHAGVYNQTLEVAKNNKAAREAMQPFIDQINELTDPAGKDKAEFERLSMKAIAAGAAKSADIKGLLEASKKADKSIAPEIDPKLKEAAYKEYAEAGTDPKALAAIKTKYPGVFGQSALDKALAGKTAPPEAAVEGRPLYNKSNDELLRMTKRAIGTSTSDARDAQAELDARKGESRMKAF